MADARGPASLAALQGVGPRRRPALTAVPSTRASADSSLSFRFKVGGTALPNTELGTPGASITDRTGLLHFGRSPSWEGSGAWLEAESGGVLLWRG